MILIFIIRCIEHCRLFPRLWSKRHETEVGDPFSLPFVWRQQVEKFKDLIRLNGARFFLDKEYQKSIIHTRGVI